MAGLALIFTLQAMAAPPACADGALALDDAYSALQTLDLERVELRLTETRGAFACGPVASTALLARFWLAEGVSRALAADADAASDALAAARRLDPSIHADAWGADVASLWSAAGNPAGTGIFLSAIDLGRSDFVAVDGAPAAFSTPLPAGLHYVQVGRFNNAFWASEVYLEPDAQLTLDIVKPAANDLPHLWSGTVLVGLYADTSVGDSLTVDVDGETWTQAATQVGVPLELGYEFRTPKAFIRPAAFIAPLATGPYIFAGETQPARFPLAFGGGVQAGYRAGEKGRVGALTQIGFPGQVRTRITGSWGIARDFHLEGRVGANLPANQRAEPAFDLGAVWLPGSG